MHPHFWVYKIINQNSFYSIMKLYNMNLNSFNNSMIILSIYSNAHIKILLNSNWNIHFTLENILNFGPIQTRYLLISQSQYHFFKCFTTFWHRFFFIKRGPLCKNINTAKSWSFYNKWDIAVMECVHKMTSIVDYKIIENSTSSINDVKVK